MMLDKGWGAALAGSLSLLLAGLGWGGEKEVDLKGTTGAPPLGWEYKGLGSAYSDGSIKLDTTGDYVVTELYNGVVTNLTVEMKGNIASEGTALEIIPSIDRLNWDAGKMQSYVVTNSKELVSFAFDAEDGFAAFKLVMNKGVGNIGLYSVKAEFIDSGTLLPPVALDATEIGEGGFTANWSSVDGATAYLIDIFQVSMEGGLIEDFDGFAAGTPDNKAHGTDIAKSLDSYTVVPGWSGEKVYQAGGSVKVGTGSDLGHLTTPEIDLSDNSGSFTISFDACGWKDDSTTMKLYLLNSGVAVGDPVEVAIPNDESYTFVSRSYNLSGGTSRSAIRFEGAKKNISRFFIDNLVISQGGAPVGWQTNFVVQGEVVSTNSYQAELGEPGLYYYQVYAADGEVTSAGSNIVTVDTSVETEPEPEHDLVYAIEMSGRSGTYLQEFDQLESSGTPEWINYAEPLPGWCGFIKQAPVASYRASGGATTAGGIYSWGTDTNRSLGSLASGGNEYTFGLAFTNISDMVITNLQVSFTALQWRVAYTNAHKQYFEYTVADKVYPLYEKQEVEWMEVEGLCFDSPLLLSGEEGDKARAIDHSESPECVVELSADLALELPPGGVVMLRWRDPDDDGSDHGFGVDNLRVVWQAQARLWPTMMLVR